MSGPARSRSAAAPPDTRPIHRAYLFRACLHGQEPLESLAAAGMHSERDYLLRGWLHDGWTAVQIAQHTRTTTYTVDRLIGQLGMADHPMTWREERTA